MKFATLIIFATLLAGCGPSQVVKGDADLVKYEDTTVVCYRIRGFDGISCITKVAL